MLLMFANVNVCPNDKIGQIILLPAGIALNAKENRNVQYDHVFLKGLPLWPVFCSHLKHLLTVCGML